MKHYVENVPLRHIVFISFVTVGVVLGCAGLVFGFTGPSTSPGVGGGALSSDSANRFAVGTSSVRTDTTLLVVASSTGTSDYVLKIMQPNQSPLLYVRNDGNVGIGDGTPEAKLSIQGGELWELSSGNSPRLVIGDTSSSGQFGFLQWDSASGYIHLETTANSTSGLKVLGNRVSIGNVSSSNNPLTVATGSTVLFLVRGDGNVGIGTSNPQGKLDINGTLALGGNVGTSGQYLTSQGAGATPTWTSAGTGVPSNYSILGTSTSTPSGYTFIGSITNTTGTTYYIYQKN